MRPAPPRIQHKSYDSAPLYSSLEMTMTRTLLEAFTVIYLLSLLKSSCWAVDLSMMPDAFDDQYVGCRRQMEREMPNILAREKKYKPFAVMWFLAEQTWVRIKPHSFLPPDFKDEYGIAVILYTKESPYPIYKELNRNVSIAGRSRDHYMDKFHFKALHFYLTRAMQVLGGGLGCDERSQVYRGSWMTYKNMSSDVRFGHFASSSLNWKTAQRFGTRTQFTIFSCFGVDIDNFSDFKEEEVLIPISEKFYAIKKSDDSYVLRSTGQHCSYYNCAYLGGEKRKNPICSSAPGMIPFFRSRRFLPVHELFFIFYIGFCNLY